MVKSLNTSKTSNRSKGGNRSSSKRSFIEQARRKQILEVSSKLFMSKGFRKTSVDDIAREADVSRGVIFYYFDGKREIGEQTIRAHLREYSDYVRERVSKRKTSQTQLLEFVDACLDYQNDHRELYLLTVELVASFGDTNDRYELTRFVNSRTRKWLVEIIEGGKKNGEYPRIPANDLADVIQGFVDGIMELSAMQPDEVDLKGCKKLMHKMILNTIKP